MFQLTAATSGAGSKGWTIDSSDQIHWSARANINFDVGIGDGTDMWAETCPDMHAHWVGKRGIAKAIWD